MLKKLETTEVIKSVITLVEKNTGLRCYDYVPKNTPAPFYYVELTGKRPDNTKTMWVEIYSVQIHAIAEKTASHVGIYKLIDDLETALTEDIELPCGYHLLLQSEAGLQNIQQDETDEHHAIITFEFRICYGFKIK